MLLFISSAGLQETTFAIVSPLDPGVGLLGPKQDTALAGFCVGKA